MSLEARIERLEEQFIVLRDRVARLEARLGPPRPAAGDDDPEDAEDVG